MLNAHSSDADSILFRVLPVTLHGNNIKLQTYAFFDDGSSLTLMDAELQERLNLKGTSQPLCLKWTANTHRYEEDSQVLELGISGANAKRRFVLKDVRTVKGLELPLQTLDVKGLQARFSHLRGLPLSSYEDAIPKLLIGLNNSRLGLSLRSREGSDNEPVAEKTRLGWTLKGVLVKQPQPAAYHAFHSCDCDAAANAELLKAVEEYVCLDNVDIKCKSASLMSKDDQQAVEQLKSTTKRIQGRFETGLLWRHSDITLPDSLPTALRRAQCLQAKLKRYPELAEILSSKIAAYVTKGYAKPLPVESLLEKGCWYLPIFPVYNPHKPGKVRLVWDAAAKTKGISLNSMLLKGPDQLTCLVSVLRRFRQRAIAVSGDIEEMYHQVRIRSEDQNYQRFVWLEPGDSKPSVFVMSVMTFGATCSPSSAQYVKNLNANEFHSRYPRAVESIVKNHYVDDMLDSVDTVEEAIQLVSNVSFIHSKGGFHIRNWRSNSEEVLNALQVNAIDSERSLDTPQEVPVEKVLGLWWLTKEDCFTFRLAQHHKIGELLRGDHRPTKREVLSVVMSIFDPLGLLNFYVIYAKVIFQDVWRSGCGWDDSVPDEHYSSWQKWVHLLPRVEGLRIPRCYFQNLGHESELEMHVFVDASENAYAATCYLRHTRGDVVNCTLIGSKVKVAPVKMLSIPRLELQAAVIGARLAAGVLTSHTLPIRRQTFWTDSRTVLAWIRSDHRRYSQFVAFRVSEILELTDVSDWRWIPSAENVADDATKWQTVPDFSNQSRWFKGPQFLKLARSHWPNDTEGTQTTVEELRAKYVGHHDAAHQPQRFLSIHERFSRWCRLLRATATVLLSVRIWKLYRKGSRMCPQLVEQEDLKHAEILLWREAQFDAVADEIALLRKGKPVARTSSIFRLSPYLDDASLLRLCGRVNLPGQEDPVILPKSHNITRLIVSDYHIKYFHGSSETVVNEIRQTFWIPRLRTVVSTKRYGVLLTCLTTRWRLRRS
ncbi:PREDICTED: uncharacterized protein LOC108381053 isoform X2 [Rhagoletis zephyria]|uniref:uncharacterized protein LOC108381053 isoform X2 n=1 Tax=Rhagoletis zephyria TaxID=28612 RepID=UPI0008119EF5|nr:PREDICTED: uncharacterized protein LOC108381053 isoform X2 [Rhagoletis zephyria]